MRTNILALDSNAHIPPYAFQFSGILGKIFERLDQVAEEVSIIKVMLISKETIAVADNSFAPLFPIQNKESFLDLNEKIKNDEEFNARLVSHELISILLNTYRLIPIDSINLCSDYLACSNGQSVIVVSCHL